MPNRLLMTGTPGEDNRKTMLNYIMFAGSPIAVYSSATVNGTYTLESGVNVDVATRTITLPASGGTRFYKLSTTIPVTIKGISVSGGVVRLTI